VGMTSTNFSQNGNGNGNGTINGRGIKHRDLTHHQLVGLAADTVTGIHPVVPSLEQVPGIFLGVSRAEVSAELKRREATHKEDEAQDALHRFVRVWDASPLSWRQSAVSIIGVDEVWDAIAEATK
jgi:hypothetical protein